MTGIAYVDTRCQAEALSSRHPLRTLVLHRGAHRYEYGYGTTPPGGRPRVARWPGVRTELIAFGYPSGIRGPQVAGTVHWIVECRGLLVAKGFLRATFGGLIDTVDIRVPWW